MPETPIHPAPVLNGHELRNGAAHEDLHHVYIARNKGASLLRISTYYSDGVEGTRPAAWPKRSTARYWATKITEQDAKHEGFYVLKCDTKGCPVCRAYREHHGIAEPNH